MPNIHEAIYALNPSIITIRGDVAYDKNEQIVQYDIEQAQAKLAELQAIQPTKEEQIAKLQAQIDALKVQP